MGQFPNAKTYDSKLVTLAQILQTLREKQDIELLVQTTLDYLTREEFDYRLVWIGLYDRLEHRLVGKGGKSPDGNGAFLRQKLAINSGDVMEQLIIQQCPVAIADLRQERRAGEWQGFAQKVGIQGTQLFPLRYKDRCFGVALLGSHLWGMSPRKAEKALLTLLFGGLATALYEVEVEWQRQAMKHPEEPLFQVLAQLQSSQTLGQRLEQVVNITHEFINPSRTNLYGYSTQKRTFWQRLSNHQTRRGYRRSPSEIRGQDVYDFYRLLASGQLVAVGTSRSSLRPEATKELLSVLNIRSLLAAPVLVYDELVGFLAVEDQNARIWESAEQKFMSAVAQATALVMGGEEVGTKLEEAKADVAFAADVTQTFARYDHPQTALGECAALLCQKLQVSRFWLLQAAEDSKGELLLASKSTATMPYRLFYHYLAAKRRQNSEEDFPLRVKDWYEIRKNSGVIAINDLEADERLSSSRQVLLKMGIKSLLVCPMGNESSGGVLLLSHHTPRTWTAGNLRLVSFIAPQLSWVLKLHLQRQEVSALTQLQTTLQHGLSHLWAIHRTQTFEQQWLEYLAKLLDTPVAMLLTWDTSPEADAKVVTVVGAPQFNDQQKISRQDPLIQATLNADGFYSTPTQDIQAVWLESLAAEQIITMTLAVQNQTPSGLILFADVKERLWSEARLKVVATLVQQFAQVYQDRSNAQVNDHDGSTNPSSPLLNWYKHRALGILHQVTTASLRTLPTSATISAQDSTQKQLLHQLNSTLSAMLPLVTEEKGQLIPRFSTIALSSVLAECLACVESDYQQKQLAAKIYSLSTFKISSDPVKLACVLVELLSLAANCAPQNGQVELWCRPLGSKRETSKASFLELSLVGPYQNTVATSNLIQPSPPWQIPVAPVRGDNPNQLMCQHMIVLLKGRLQFYQLRDQRCLNRLILPVAED